MVPCNRLTSTWLMPSALASFLVTPDAQAAHDMPSTLRRSIPLTGDRVGCGVGTSIEPLWSSTQPASASEKPASSSSATSKPEYRTAPSRFAARADVFKANLPVLRDLRYTVVPETDCRAVVTASRHLSQLMPLTTMLTTGLPTGPLSTCCSFDKSPALSLESPIFRGEGARRPTFSSSGDFLSSELTLLQAGLAAVLHCRSSSQHASLRPVK
mmetsp:Transcript_8833/g.32566  ORF Transcript_8833/g.32566 Transcript_8833/m.32566 type:complete len:213 (+) Transcript_8833:868-1506(+)